MEIRHFNKVEDWGPDVLGDVDQEESDPSTTVFKGSPVAHVEIDDTDTMTVYTENGSFYVNLTEDDFRKISEVVKEWEMTL